MIIVNCLPSITDVDSDIFFFLLCGDPKHYQSLITKYFTTGTFFFICFMSVDNSNIDSPMIFLFCRDVVCPSISSNVTLRRSSGKMKSVYTPSSSSQNITSHPQNITPDTRETVVTSSHQNAHTGDTISSETDQVSPETGPKPMDTETRYGYSWALIFFMIL